MHFKRNIVVNNHHYQVDVPDACPVCHHFSEIQVVSADFIDNKDGIQAIFRCGFSGCRQHFLGYYDKVPTTGIVAVRPTKPRTEEFPDCVANLSPTFVQVFKESAEAFHLGLRQIAGPGYRKAFEFLIKDYAKSKSQQNAQEIEGMFSGNVVAQFISDVRIQAVAKRCLWLGNDETHYMRKWTDHDINDLVTLIKLTTSWIEIEQLSQSYMESMPD